MSKKKIAVLIAALALMAGLFTGVYLFARGNTAGNGEKHIAVDIIADGKTTTFKIDTDEAFLRGALEQEKLIEGHEDAVSFFVTAVNGRVADDSKQEWWGFTKNGEMLMTGVNDTPIADGDKYEITLNEGWDSFQ